MAAASVTFRAAGSPVVLALVTAIGPTSASRVSATSCCGMRTATVPLVSPRSHISEAWARSTRVRPPGQNALISSRA